MNAADRFNIVIGITSFAILGAGWIARQIFIAFKSWAHALEVRVDSLEDKLNDQKLDLVEIKAYQRGYHEAREILKSSASQT